MMETKLEKRKRRNEQVSFIRAMMFLKTEQELHVARRLYKKRFGRSINE